MNRVRTEEELERLKPAFGSEGIFQSIVRTGMERESNIKVDAGVLEEFFHNLNLHGIGKLINLLSANESSMGIKEFGFSSIDFTGVLNGAFTFEAAKKLVSLYIGLPKFNVTPLQWLAYLSKGVNSISQEHLVALDDVADGYVTIMTAFLNRDFEEVEEY